MDELKFTHNELLESENIELKKALNKANTMLENLKDKYDAIKHLLSSVKVAEHEYIIKRENEDNKKEKE